MATPRLKRRICILGAGFLGLGCAQALLLNQGKNEVFEIIVLSKAFTPQTTSDIAGGLWLPFKSYHNKITQWSATTQKHLDALQKLTFFGRNNPYGVHTSDLYFFIHGHEGEEDLASWRDIIPSEVKEIDLNSMRHPEHTKAIHHMQVPVVNTSQYLETLHDVLLHTGQVKFIRYTVESIPEVIDNFKPDVVVNCLGLAAREVVPDPLVFPTRGALAIVAPTKENEPKIVNTVYMYDDNPDGLTYIITRPDGCFIGGTAQDNCWNLTVDESEATHLLQRAQTICEPLDGAKIVGTKVGLRPSRKPTLLEVDPSYSNALVIHNYGHGGSGITVHWGCALDVVELVQKHIGDIVPKSKL